MPVTFYTPFTRWLRLLPFFILPVGSTHWITCRSPFPTPDTGWVLGSFSTHTDCCSRGRLPAPLHVTHTFTVVAGCVVYVALDPFHYPTFYRCTRRCPLLLFLPLWTAPFAAPGALHGLYRLLPYVLYRTGCGYRLPHTVLHADARTAALRSLLLHHGSAPHGYGYRHGCWDCTFGSGYASCNIRHVTGRLRLVAHTATVLAGFPDRTTTPVPRSHYPAPTHHAARTRLDCLPRVTFFAPRCPDCYPSHVQSTAARSCCRTVSAHAPFQVPRLPVVCGLVYLLLPRTFTLRCYMPSHV